MTVVPLRAITIVAQEQDQEAIIAALHDAGIVHIDAEPQRTPSSLIANKIQNCQQKLDAIAASIEFLKRFSGSPHAIPEKIQEGELLLARTQTIARAYTASKQAIEKLKADIDFYSPFGCLELNGEPLQQARMSIKLAKLAHDEYQQLTTQDFHWQLISHKNHAYYVAFIVTDQQTIAPYATADLPPLSLAKLEKNLHAERMRLIKLDQEASRLAFQCRVLENLKNTTQLELVRLKELTKATTSQGLIAFKGFIEARHVYELRHTLSSFAVYLSIAKPSLDDVPVSVKNPPALQGFAALVRRYTGLNSKESDKTLLVALFFMIFSAFCVLDAGYGFLLLIIGYVTALKKHKNLGSISMWSGATSIVLGLCCGRVFGLQWGESIMRTTPPLLTWLTHPLDLLYVSLLLGMATMAITYLCALKEHGIFRAELGSLLALIGCTLFIIKQSGLLIGEFSDPSSILFYAALGAFLLSAITWAITPVTIHGATRLFNIVWTLLAQPARLFRGVASHTCLFASALTIALLASATNHLAQSLPLYMGAITAAGGHMLVFLLSTFLLFIHSNHLIFFEFGSTCIQGGHTYFTPFARSRWL